MCAALPSGHHICHHRLSDGGSISELINCCFTWYTSPETIGAPGPNEVLYAYFSSLSTAVRPTTEGIRMLLVSQWNSHDKWTNLLNNLVFRLTIDVPVNGPLASRPHWEYVHPSSRNLNLRIWCFQGRD